jgi:ABC-type dipeptide/oligopeptide/nickel transport system permease component
MLLPLIALGIGVSAIQVRLLRSTLLDVLRNEYVRTGRAKGLPEGLVISRHALKNCLIPVITLLGTQVSFTLGGSVVLENIFSLPGLGRLTLMAIDKGDFPQLQANILYLLFIYLAINLVVDLSYAWLDPRIRYR